MSEEPVWAPQTAARRRRVVVNVLRALVLVVVIGGWELATRLRWVDPFFFGQPSLIWSQIVTWATKGTAQGPLHWTGNFDEVQDFEGQIRNFALGTGLMSDADGYRVAADYARLDALAKSLGSALSAPFMTLSFMALLVIPALKLGPMGPFDVTAFRPVSLWVS